MTTAFKVLSHWRHVATHVATQVAQLVARLVSENVAGTVHTGDMSPHKLPSVPFARGRRCTQTCRRVLSHWRHVRRLVWRHVWQHVASVKALLETRSRAIACSVYDI